MKQQTLKLRTMQRSHKTQETEEDQGRDGETI